MYGKFRGSVRSGVTTAGTSAHPPSSASPQYHAFIERGEKESRSAEVSYVKIANSCY